MLHSGPTEGLDDLPRRIFLDGVQKPLTDPFDGFVRPIGKILSVQELLAYSAVLVVAPPLTGKSFVAKQLERVLTLEPSSEAFPWRGPCERTSFEISGRTTRLAPLWWESWQGGTEQAWWLVDALDEDERRGDRRAQEILDLVRSLPLEARSRLHLILFSRLNEVPAWCEEQLPKLEGFRKVRLAGLTRDEARTLVGSERFDHVCNLIRNSRLQSLASYPSVLEHLRKQPADASLTEEEVWRGVLMDLLQGRRRDPFLSPLEPERFEVAQRLAAIVTFCGEQALRLNTPGLEGLLPARAQHLGDLRLAAEEVVGKTAIFERSADGFRFAQDHVRQWLTAFALQEMPLLQVRPLLTLESGKLDPSHEGVMSFLAKISKHSEVRDWIFAEHGGLPDSESIPWSLDGAIRALDRLQESARLSTWGLRMWGEDRLGSFKIDGLGGEVARRLEGADLLPTEQQFLFDVASAIEAAEVLPIAVRLVQAPEQDQRVRAQGADFVASFGGREHLEPLAEWVLSISETDEHDDAVLSTLAASFYTQGLWTFEETADFALSRPSLGRDWLHYRLAEDLSLDQARWLLRERVLSNPDLPLQRLMTEALNRLKDQETLCESDIELLVPLVFRWESLIPGEGAQLLRSLQKSARARREIFSEGLLRDPQCQGDKTWLWLHVLSGEDAEWLLSLLRRTEERPSWLLQSLYFTAYRSGSSLRIRRSIRRALQTYDEELLRQLDKNRKQWTDMERRQRQRSQREAQRIFELEPLVWETLENEDIELRHKMLRLSRCCFEPPGERPSNVSGRWEDLPGELRLEALAVCRRALAECPPTEISEGSTYSSWTSHEAVCFDHLVKEDEAFHLTPELIRKWLPALLRDWVSGSGYEATLRRCFDVDRNLSEDLFFEAVRRSILFLKSTYTLQNLPRELWSERFSAMLEMVIMDASVEPEVRIECLTQIGRVFPGRAQPIASACAQTPEATLRDAGIDILLMAAPEEGWIRLKRLIENEPPEHVLLRMRALLPNHYGPSAAFSSWTALQLAELEELLLQSFPSESDPKLGSGEGRSLGEEDDLRSLRREVPRLLYRRNQEGDRAVLDRLAYDYPHIRHWLTQAQAEDGAEGMLAELGWERGHLGTGRKIELEELVKVLLDARYRLLRTTGDLWKVLQEQLQLISLESKQHLSVLYHPRPRKKGEKRKHLQEDALQAYLYIRLNDRLPVVLGTTGWKVEPAVNREPLAARDTRNDIKVQAPSINGGLLTVIIEIKWSDHRDVSTSLVNQLGKGYLLENNLTHGIYLVGWSDDTKPWKSTLGSASEPRSSREAWQKSLTEQAELFCQAHPELRITPLVVDLTWEPEPAPAT